MKKYIDEAINQGLFPGCIAQFQDGDKKTVFRQGTMEFQNGKKQPRPVVEETLYDIASLTKVIIFLGLLRLVNYNKVLLSDPIVNFLPFKGDDELREMSIWHLLTCGLDFVLSKDLEQNGIHQKRGDGLFRIYFESTLREEVGQMFRYSNLLAFFAGEIVRKITDLSLGEVIQKLILVPLGMLDTSFKLGPSKLVRVAPTQIVNSTEWRTGIVQDPMSQAFLSYEVGCSGIFSSISDMSRLVKFLSTGLSLTGVEFLPKPLWQDMLSDQLQGKVFPGGEIHRYGLGIDKPSEGYVDDDYFCEHGVFMSGTSGPFVFACPDWRRSGLSPRPIGGVILCNTRRDMPEAKLVHREFRRGLLRTFLNGIKE